ncbi:MAG: M1 family peptidase [Bacteroidetes bacterium]|nr:MAG: M1 family peptidase [Bacteroidota bacterium]
MNAPVCFAGIRAGILFLFIASATFLPAQSWQQRVSYQIEVSLDVTSHRYTGKAALVYTNHSPDTLRRAFFHLFNNAFQPGSMMDQRARNISDPDRRVGDRISQLGPDEIGYLHVKDLHQNGVAVSATEVGTILEVDLAHPILPGGVAVFDLDFEGQVPVQIRRSGRDNREGVAYTMTQWYPKLCEYDAEGWHANPYVGREFHGVWGDFDVRITLDSAYTVGGTGYLQNPEEIGHGYLPAGQAPQRPAGDQLTWHFVAPRVHDFAWAADPDYVHTTAQVPGGPLLHFFFQDNQRAEKWRQLPPYAVAMFEMMREAVGPYPYEQYSVIEGGDGGMEYAMCTMINSSRGLGSLLSTTAHEAIHSWFQHVLATNESLYPWMDEGFTSYYDAWVMDRIYGMNLLNPQYLDYLNYVDVVESGMEEVSATHADHYQTNHGYARGSYTKGSLLLSNLNYVMGEAAFQRGMRRYYTEWQFRHPEPRDFKRVMEKESGLELDWLFQYWIGTTHTIDYGLEVAETVDKRGTQITLTRLGAIPMPIDLLVTYTDGQQEWYYLPLRIMRGKKGADRYELPRQVLPDWPWTQPSYALTLERPLDEITSVEIDPSYRMADVNRRNNRYPDPKKDKAYRPVWESYGAVPR